MNEYEKLQALITLEKEEHLFELKIQSSNNKKEAAELETEKLFLEPKIDKLKMDLSQEKNNEFSQRALQAIKNQIEAYITEVEKTNQNFYLLRDQGLNYSDWLFSSLLMDIKRPLESDFYGHSIPEYLHYTTEKTNGVNLESFLTFLRKELNNLYRIENVDYIKLRDYFEAFKNHLVDKFINK